MNDVCGVYKIENKLNGKVYIGQSKNVYKRFMQHKAKLDRGEHCGRHLQFAWDFYGKDNFEFALIEECKESELDEHEVYWIDVYDSYNNGYNATIGGGKRGWKVPEDVVLKRTGANNASARMVVCLNTGKVYDCIVDAADEYGIEKSLITMCCRNKIKSCGGKVTGKPSVWVYYEDYLRMGATDIENKIISANIRSKSKKKHTKNCAQSRPVECISTNMVYDSTRAASRQLNICETSIWKCYNGERKTAGGMEWRYFCNNERTVA